MDARLRAVRTPPRFRIRLLSRLAPVLPVLFPLAAGAAQGAPRVAVFDFEMFDTSGQNILAERQAETKRLALITADLRKRLSDAGYELVDLSPQKGAIEDRSPFRNCNSCEVPIARALGADIEVIGLVQKVSNLILNINFQLRDTESGAVLRAGSVDIRNNTDESWLRGVSYLVRNRLLDPPLTGKAALDAATPAPKP
ncbi:DUF3280 domain-containing protein [Ancylobacter sp. 6x-1]|uniref:DUF3280 domain-containing protein n=1 Tax=Ancylobacter crimeensis TaxID=2579147 RepID=A0ABT0D8I9_9HYPH|nr:DUF3280 domain-containing protein [Ancylobacter crimeensis]MCK0196275.1 DUF3280 domain-containing protein [Ancylobacter crimeensis]